MSTSELFERALKLPGDERLELAEALLSSVEPAGSLPFDSEWLAEAKRRVARIDAGEGRSKSWEEVQERGRQIIEDNRA